MKKFTYLAAVAMIAFTSNAVAQDDATASVETSAEIITPISIEGSDILSFGDIVGTADGGTVTVTSGGDRNSSATDLLIDGTPGTVSAASFNVTGQDSYTFAITLPGEFSVENGDATETMVVSDFETTPDATGTLTGGTETITVGATLTVGAAQAPGTYSHADGLEITVNYN